MLPFVVGVDIEILVVPDCPHHTSANELVRTAVADTGVRSSVTMTVIETADEAQQRHFAGSPTILIDGQDPFVQGNDSVGLACRLYPTTQGLAGLPPLPDLRQALKQAADVSPER
jgi:hypothetical protein